MTLETTFHLPRGCSVLKTDGQGRIICFLVQWSLEPPRVMIIHLDYPGVTLESKFLKTYMFENGRIVSNSHFPHGFTNSLTRVSSHIYGTSVSRPKA